MTANQSFGMMITSISRIRKKEKKRLMIALISFKLCVYFTIINTMFSTVLLNCSVYNKGGTNWKFKLGSCYAANGHWVRLWLRLGHNQAAWELQTNLLKPTPHQTARTRTRKPHMLLEWWSSWCLASAPSSLKCRGLLALFRACCVTFLSTQQHYVPKNVPCRHKKLRRNLSTFHTWRDTMGN